MRTHGPHHSAQKSTSTGFLLFRTICSKFFSVKVTALVSPPSSPPLPPQPAPRNKKVPIRMNRGMARRVMACLQEEHRKPDFILPGDWHNSNEHWWKATPWS